ncbi:MAG TPA: lysylphosphatidylglycerol synthase domain-containing protein [Gemmatimonadales bacterium]|nr:lysylphosphatidylglycerol synthase domain-containing protein [Gemmatimonadales bacterium]
MSRRWQLLLLAVGAALFALVVRQIGVDEIARNAAEVGWLFLPVMLLYGIAYACSAVAWLLAMPPDTPRPSFWRAYAITVSGFSLNYVTPMVNAGGEPFRMAAVSPWLGRRGAASSVIVHRMLHTLGLLLTWIASLVLALFLLPASATVVGVLLAALAVVVGLSWLLLRGHQHGVLEGGLDLLYRVPVVGRAAARLEPRRPVLAAMDAQIAALYREAPRRFYGSLALEFASRVLLAVEYWLICYGIGTPATFAQAYLITGLSSIALNALFFIPFELGSKEGVLYLLFQLVGLSPEAGVYTAIVSRARDMLWIAGGLLLLGMVRHQGNPDRAPPRAAPPEMAR